LCCIEWAVGFVFVEGRDQQRNKGAHADSWKINRNLLVLYVHQRRNSRKLETETGPKTVYKGKLFCWWFIDKQ